MAKTPPMGKTEAEHAAFLIANKATHAVTLDNDCYGIYAKGSEPGDDDEREGQWFYDCHPDDLFRCLLDHLGIAHEEV